ncbi:Rha family transcriptional regulator [Pseudomonas putida]|uniref:Rha family transcriptional regulator n=1 Tax=Pseudomonas putida TaxID=303 RepID=UPI0018E67A1C|nr:Rha family transcriptional regulator [Pseudomonas putida]MBI6944370.1 Rha family transcriptional regulator [Pseudomonas putida]MBI6960682.1 Rha family transcriptional regulator [Pseudomonas putida]
MSLMTTAALTMSSQEIAELVGSRHDSVKRTIERLAERKTISQPPLVDGPRSGNGVVVQEFLINKRDSFVVVAQLSPEFTAALVDRWQKLEEQVAAPALPTDYISALEHLLASKRSEQLALEQRDHAVATKAEIGSRREATAMAKASAAVREAAKLRDELGFSTRHATILKVQAATNRRFSFVNLRRWCKANGVTPETVQDNRYPEGVKAWPAAAWAAVFDIDLAELFGTAGEHE